MSSSPCLLCIRAAPARRKREREIVFHETNESNWLIETTKIIPNFVSISLLFIFFSVLLELRGLPLICFNMHIQMLWWYDNKFINLDSPLYIISIFSFLFFRFFFEVLWSPWRNFNSIFDFFLLVTLFIFGNHIFWWLRYGLFWCGNKFQF